MYDEPSKEEKESIPKQEESSIAESPSIPSKDSAIDPELQIPQISKEEEIHCLDHSFDLEAKLLADLPGFGNAIQKRPSKKHRLNTLKKRSL